MANLRFSCTTCINDYFHVRLGTIYLIICTLKTVQDYPSKVYHRKDSLDSQVGS